MASDIVFTPKSGSDQSLSPFTLFGDVQAAIAAAGVTNFAWTDIVAISPTPTRIIPLPGFPTVEAKYMGGATARWKVTGVIVDDADNEANIVSAGIALYAKNQSKGIWEIKIGSVTISSSANAALGEISLFPLGDGSGPRWGFEIPWVNRGGA